MTYAIIKQPITANAVAVQAKHIPGGSNANSGMSGLVRIVKTGEKRRMTSVFRPT